MSKALIRKVALCAVLLAPLPALAGENNHPLADLSNSADALGHTAVGLGKDVMSFFGFGKDQANNPTDPQPVAAIEPERPKTELTARSIAPAGTIAETVAAVQVPAIPAAAEKPSVETPLKRLFCVEYARMRSGLAVFGDAKHWWERAKNLYARASHPVQEAVMVFSGSKRLKRGHVAVVTDIVSPREIIVDQANWQNRGEIDHATPVLDVSKNNDWSAVRVWDIPSGTFGSRVYAISGFITKASLTRQAMND